MYLLVRESFGRTQNIKFKKQPGYCILLLLLAFSSYCRVLTSSNIHSRNYFCTRRRRRLFLYHFIIFIYIIKHTV
jgi:hypothetical protein